MRIQHLIFVTLLMLTAGCSRPESTDTPSSKSTPAPNAETVKSAGTTPTAETGKARSAAIKPLTEEQQEQLLGARLEGGMDSSFRQFANRFLISSRIQLDTGVGLVTSSREISESQLQSPFPGFYKPTLRELLDAIALQTFSEWRYDPTSKYFKSEVESESPVQGLAMFEFTQAKRQKPFQVDLAKGWQSIDKGNWLMLVPPNFPVGMDIYEMGTYSSDDKTTTKDLFNKVRTEVALEWAKRVRQDASQKDLKSVKVGPYEALFFESMVPSQLGKEIHWRQWVFMNDDKCYFVVSTILPELEKKIFPDVEKMLASIRVKK